MFLSNLLYNSPYDRLHCLYIHRINYSIECMCPSQPPCPLSLPRSSQRPGSFRATAHYFVTYSGRIMSLRSGYGDAMLPLPITPPSVSLLGSSWPSSCSPRRLFCTNIAIPFVSVTEGDDAVESHISQKVPRHHRKVQLNSHRRRPRLRPPIRPRMDRPDGTARFSA